MMEADDDDGKSIYSAYSAASSWAGTMGGISTYSGSSSIADAFAMRQGMGLDAMVLQSAILDASDSASATSFTSSTSRNSRRKKSVRHPPTKQSTAPSSNENRGMHDSEGKIQGTKISIGGRNHEASHTQSSSLSSVLRQKSQQEVPPVCSPNASGMQAHQMQRRVSQNKDRTSVDVNKAIDRLTLMREQHSRLKQGQQQQAEDSYPRVTLLHKDNFSPTDLPQQQLQQQEQQQQQQQQQHLQPNCRTSGSNVTHTIDMSNQSMRMQAAAMLLMDDDDDVAGEKLNHSDGIMLDAEIANKSASWGQTWKSLHMKSDRKTSMWDQKKSDDIDHQTKNAVNLVLGDKYGEGGDDGYDDRFQDEDPFGGESFMARQLNQRKRIRITKRKKTTKPLLRRRDWIRRSLMATALFMVAIVIMVAITLVIKRSNGHSESEVQQVSEGPMNDDIGGNSTGRDDDAVSNSTNSSNVADDEDTEAIDSATDAAEGNNQEEAVAADEEAPSYPPSEPTSVPVRYPSNCFTSRDLLKTTVDYYMMDRSKYSPVAQKYGWPINEWCVSGVTDFSGMFQNGNLATGLINHEDPLSIRFAHFDESLGKWDVSNAVDMSNMFRGAKRFTGQGLNQWNVSKVTTMSNMFHGAESFHQDLNSWDVSNVANFEGMFEGAKQMDGDISKWNTRSAQNMQRMFRDAYTFNGDLRGWNTSNVQHMAEMFARAISFRGGDLRRWDVSKVSNMEGVFFEARSFDGIISTWNVSAVKRMSQMFQGASSFNSVISKWDVSSVEEMSFMFAFAPKFDSSIAKWNTHNVRYMDAMFFNATRFNQPIGNWNVSSVKVSDIMFMNARKFNYSLSSWSMTSVEKIGGMFAGASSFHHDMCAWGQTLPGGEDRALLLNSDHVEAKHTSVFSGTSCPETGNPIFLVDPSGPFCERCY